MGEITRIGEVRRRAGGSDVPGRRTDRREPLWRELLGGQIRRRRRAVSRTLTDLAEAAGMSPQYLSEIERGRKEPSSEMIAAVARALDTTLMDLTADVTLELHGAAGARDVAAPARRSAGDGQVLALVG